MIALLLAAFLALPAQAQEWNSACFGGLNDSQTAATLPDCESPDMLNVESNLNGTAMLKRKGFAKSADLTIATGPVTGSHSFIDSSGNRLDIVCQDRNCAKSTNGNAFATFLTTAASGITRWSFVDQGGILYGANNKYDPIMKYDGTTRSSPATMPLGSILALTQDRLAVGDISTLPNRVHYSSAGAYEQFTVGVNPEDSFFDDIGADGDRIRGIKCLQGNCFLFKTASITVCEMADQYNTRCSVISPSIGTTDPASIVAAGPDLYFRAQDKNYWRVGRGGLDQISKKIPNLVKSQSGGLGGGENTNTQTTKADWEAGVQLPLLSWNTATTNGSIFPSSSTIINSAPSVSSQTFYMTDVDTAATPSSSYVSNFDGSSLTSGLAWTQRLGSVVSSNNEVRFSTKAANQRASMTSVVEHSTGTWMFMFASTATSTNGPAVEMYFLSNSTAVNATSGYMTRVVQGLNVTAKTEVQLYRMTAGVVASTVFTFETPNNLFNGAYHSIRVSRATNGYMEVFFDGTRAGSGTDATYSTSTYILFSALNGSGVGEAGDIERIHVDSITAPAFYNNQVSAGYNTLFSTPIWGPYSVSLASSTSASATFYIQASANGTTWDAAVTVANGARPSSTGLQYVRHQIAVGPPSVTPVQTFSGATLQFATTGQFRTQCIQPNSSISSWGTLSCAQTIVGNGSEVFYATSAATCGGLPTTHPVDAAGAVQSGWTAQTNNATVTIATNTAVYIGWRSLLGSATDQAQVDACVLAWNEGTPAQPSWAAYDSVKNAIYWTSTINSASSTNRLLKYDLNLEQWYPFDIAAQAPRVINNSLYFGGASAGTWNLYGGVDADAGAAINAYRTSKDIGSDRPFQAKSFERVSVLSRNNGSGNLTGTWTLSNAKTGAYTISLSTGTGISYARSNYKLPLSSPQQFMNLKIGNNSATPFEVLGMGIYWSVLPWRVEGP